MDGGQPPAALRTKHISTHTRQVMATSKSWVKVEGNGCRSPDWFPCIRQAGSVPKVRRVQGDLFGRFCARRVPICRDRRHQEQADARLSALQDLRSQISTNCCTASPRKPRRHQKSSGRRRSGDGRHGAEDPHASGHAGSSAEPTYPADRLTAGLSIRFDSYESALCRIPVGGLDFYIRPFNGIMFPKWLLSLTTRIA